MRIIPERIKQVIWIASNNIAYYNLPEYMLQYWTYFYELNGILKDLVIFFIDQYKAINKLLNLLALPYIPSKIENYNREINNLINNQNKKYKVTYKENFDKEIHYFSSNYKYLQISKDKDDSNDICDKEIIENLRNEVA